MSEVVIMNDSVVEPQAYVGVHIRWLIRRDLPEVLEIEEASFPQNQLWDKEDFLEYLRQRNLIGMVAEQGERVLGFMMYEMHEKHLLLLSMAVHPDFLGRGIGRQMVAKLQAKLSPERRTKIIALVPEPCAQKAAPFFEKYGIEIHLTDTKGKVTYRPKFSAMSSQDVPEVERMEKAFMRHYGKEPRDIASMIANGTRFGIVARNASDGALLGFALYSREASGIDFNGEFGIIVKPRCRGQGIGRKLMMELVKQKLPITVSDIFLLCKSQVGFLKAMGVPVPELQKFVTVKWDPTQTVS